MRKTLLQLLFISCLSIFISSCEKEEERFPESKKVEKTVVELPLAANGPLTVLALDLTPGVKTINVVEIKRDPKNPAEFYKKLVVKVKHQNAMISDPSSGEIKELPRNLYTNHPDNPFDGQYWTVTFEPGQWSAFVKINLDPAVLFTVTSRVGLGFVLAESSEAKISETNSQLGVEISAKNQWDGTYAVRGPVVDILTPNLIEWANQPGYSDAWLDAHPGAWEAHLITINATECVVFDNTVWGLPAIPLYNTNPIQNTGYGSFGIIITFDPATNKVAKVRNYYGDSTQGLANALGDPSLGTGPPLYQASNTRSAVLDPTGTNAVAGNKNISMKYLMFHPSAVPTGPRTTFTQTFEYIGPR